MAKEKRSYQEPYTRRLGTNEDPSGVVPTDASSMQAESLPSMTYGVTEEVRDGDPAPNESDPIPSGVRMDLDKVDPTDRGLVNRATAKYGGIIDDDRTEGEKMGGFWGGAMDLADDFFPDDVGGLVAGDSDQWFRVPYLTDAYKHTLGSGLGYSMEVAGAGLNALTWTADQVNANHGPRVGNGRLGWSKHCR